MSKIKNNNENIVNAISKIETNSNIEIVLFKEEKAADYTDIQLFGGIVFTIIVFTFLMFSKAIFGNYLFYVLTVGSFFIGYFIFLFFEKQFMFLVNIKRKNVNVEIRARAIFQKAGIYKTQKQTGMLIYLAVFEKKSFIVSDIGVDTLISEEILKQLQTKFDNTLKSSYSEKKISDILLNYSDVFSEYIPKKQDDTNEIPNNISVDF
ncbi:MAG: hypothetical protein JXR68_01720 [Bacteroidales bacterium]|nr:hypothetical protein [Bacteroidales bacterium]